MPRIFTKQPNENKDYDFDWTDWMPSGDSLSTSTIIWKDPATTSEEGVTLGSKSHSGSVVKQFISGGSDGSDYVITCSIATTQGRTAEEEIIIQVRAVPSVVDVGTLVTNDEVSSFVPGWSIGGYFTVAEKLLLKGVEAEVKREIGKDLAVTSYTDEEYSIPAPVIRDGLTIRFSTEFRVRQFPITSWFSLKKVTERSTTTGLASKTETLPRESYHVELVTGIIRILKPDKLDPFNIWPATGFPEGTMILLASYTAGQVSDDLKLLILQITARLYIQQKNALWGRTSQAVDGLQNEYPDISFTANELRKLMKFKKWHFA